MTAERPAWCLACGRPAVRVLGPGVAGTYPIVRCEWRDRAGKAHGCGRQPGTYDEGEARTLAWRRHEARVRAAHEAGRHLAKPLRSCFRCADALIHAHHKRERRRVDGCPLCDELPVSTLEAWAHGRT